VSGDGCKRPSLPFNEILKTEYILKMEYKISIEELKKMPKPSHIAIIMDGNGRWAKKQGQQRTFGHMKGVAVVEKITEFCAAIGVNILTLYSFSTENWKRPAEEVNFLMSIFCEYMKNKLHKFLSNGIKFNVMGRLDGLSTSVIETIKETENATKHCGGMILNLAVNYSGRAEIVDALKKAVADYELNKKKSLSDASCPPANEAGLISKLAYIDENYIKKLLYEPEFSDPDLLIRTSNEFRVSNFLLWQIAYTEFFITPKFWPDFDENDVIDAICDYNSRERRFGGLNAAQ